MKHLVICGAILLPWLSGLVVADCTTTQVLITGGPNGLAATLSGMTINATSPAGENWKEQHVGGSGGALNKVGLGCSHPVDPTVPVGTWSVGKTGNPANTARVTYSYTGGSSYTWSVHNNGNGTYTFCSGPGGNEIATGTFSSNVLCGP